jgi:hypothetical protein
MTAECNQFVFGFHPQNRREIRAQVWISLAGGYPHVALFRQVHEKLCAVPVKY